MSKFLFFLLFITISLGYLFKVDQLISKNFNPLNSIKKSYVETSLSFKNIKDRYFNQVLQIEELQKVNTELKNYKLYYLSTKNKLDSILEALDSSSSIAQQISFTQVISYINFNDFTKVWLNLEKKDDVILGLISEQYAAGIVLNQNGKAKAFLNGNEKANYAIFIGENKAPGIIHASKNKEYLVAKYIPIWFDIKIGDEVITSGMDDIFFEGLKVGKIISIKKMQDIQEATIMAYAKVLKQKSFFVYKKIHKEKSPEKILTKDTKKNL